MKREERKEEGHGTCLASLSLTGSGGKKEEGEKQADQERKKKILGPRAGRKDSKNSGQYIKKHKAL